jgi:dTMP kinase
MIDRVNRGKYIVIEGPDGAGKSTQTVKIAEKLGILTVHEPGGDNFGQVIRSILLDPAADARDPHTDLMLQTAQRIELMHSTIRPALKNGINVISDRNWLSSFAYQGAQGVALEFIRYVSSTVLESDEYEPDLTIILDVPGTVSHARLDPSKLDYYEKLGPAFQESVRENYLAASQIIKHTTVIDGGRSVEVAYSDLEQHISKALSV